ncbi:MAG: glycosyltransferase [Vitreimonas sp.]
MDKFPSRERESAVALEPRVSAIVVVRNVQSLSAQHALDLSLRAALAEPWIDDLVIVDAGNATGISSSLRALQMDRRDVKVVVAPLGASAGAAANLGAEHARGRWLLFLAPNVILQRGAAERLAAAGGSARAPWLVGGRLTNAEGREHRAARAGTLNTWSAIAVALGWNGARPSARRGAVGRDDAPLPAEVGAVSGAFMLAPQHDFQALGGFDVDFLTDGADLDLCRRAVAAGGSVLFQPVAAGVQFMRTPSQGRRQAQGLALFAMRSARTPFQRAFALIAAPALSVLIGLRDFVMGRPAAR